MRLARLPAHRPRRAMTAELRRFHGGGDRAGRTLNHAHGKSQLPVPIKLGDRFAATMDAERRAEERGDCTTLVWYSLVVDAPAVIERISELLDRDGSRTSNTSMRIPTTLRDAAALAVGELGVAASATALTTAALRATLEAVVMQARPRCPL